ncbi:helix-turn-helix domain-containing protein [Aquimarina rubra]|uniref:Helix-turn-helix domain-containing protein n=1 Tax=Aquimarina rubra TaxID=1920033 RepID=A0ABW5L9W7_9FLAO
MYQTQRNTIASFFQILLLCIFCNAGLFGNESRITAISNDFSETEYILRKADNYFNLNKYNEAISCYELLFDQQYEDSTYLYKKIAFSYAKSNQPEQAIVYVEKYILATLDVSFVNHSYFDSIKNEENFKTLQKRYQQKISVWALFCLYVGCIGVFISTILIFRQRKDRIANFLIGCFLLLHSLFILRVSILITNYEFYLPHLLYASASFSFLYGPLIFFYFKRVYQQHRFNKIDILHLLPTLVFIAFMMPIYLLSSTEKLHMIIHNERPYANLIMMAKLISLTIYGILIIFMYLKKEDFNNNIARLEKNWIRNLIIFYSLSTLFYAIYAFIFKQYEMGSSLFNLQIFIMTLLVLYISYNTFFNLALVRDKNIRILTNTEKSDSFKYSSSSLTSELSVELKDKLIVLMNQEKIYRDNDITLQKLADRLNTNRHNTSQIINEHFGLNFFDLINSYRINEAMSILKKDKSKGVNIIDVAYEVGFNNKVTFNKSFKKYNHITPSEYLRSFGIS